jgi:hypothetical protein
MQLLQVFHVQLDDLGELFQIPGLWLQPLTFLYRQQVFLYQFVHGFS